MQFKHFELNDTDFSGQVMLADYEPGQVEKHIVETYGQRQVVEGLREPGAITIAWVPGENELVIALHAALGTNLTITTEFGKLNAQLTLISESTAYFLVNDGVA